MNTHTRILIVEDDTCIAHDMKQILSALGYTVSSVIASGEHAIQLINKDPPDLVLVDIELSGEMNGIEAAQHIRSKHDIPILYLTVHSDQNLIKRAKITEPFGFILKPFREKELQSAIEVALYKHQMETKLKETNRELEQETEERRRAEEELAKAKEVAEEIQRAAEFASHAKSEFLANMGHELRTPLNAILGYAQILRDANNLTERQRENLDTIKSSGEHLLNMINEILDLSKIEAGQLELQESEFHLPEFLKNITKIMQVRAEQKGIVFLYESDLDLPEGVRADEKRLQETLINLLDNAITFTEKGRVTFRVSKERSNGVLGYWSIGKDSERSTTSTLQHSNTPIRLRFQVEDTGIGIAPEKLKEIFLPFQQVGTKRYTVKGIGLGLAISYRLVHMMGGELHVQSSLGKGSVFWFELNLPMVENVIASVVKQSRKIIGYTGKRRTILIADDQVGNRGMLVDRLSLLGFDILEAENGQECVEKTLNNKPDLILLDLLMPVMDGFEAVQQIRELDTGSSILDTGYSMLDAGYQYPASSIQRPASSDQHPASSIQLPVIIAVSASAYEKTRKKSLEAGCDDFLSKPIQFETLLERLQSHLHLEWIYQEEAKREAEIGVQTDKEPVQIMPLPPEETANLLELARLGIVKQILTEIDTLEQQDTKYTSVLKILRQFAKNYQFDRIIELLEKRSGANGT